MKTPTEEEIVDLLIVCRSAATLRQGRRNTKKLVAEKDSKQRELFTIENRCASTPEAEAWFKKIKERIS
jgi:hypothetical protein